MKSVASATGTPPSIKRAARAPVSSCRGRASSRGAASPPSPAAASAAMPRVGDRGEVVGRRRRPARRRARRRRTGVSSSACSLSASPLRAAAVRIVARLLDGEDARLAEDVGEARQLAGARRAGASPRMSSAEIRRRASPARSRCSSGISCAPSKVGTMRIGSSRGEPRDHAQRLELILEREAVAGLHLDGGGAEGREAAEARAARVRRARPRCACGDRAPTRGCRRRARAISM